MSTIHTDPRISFRAKGIYSYIAVQGDSVLITVDSIISSSREGRTAVQRALAELELLGYLTRERVRTRGRIHSMRYVLHQQPTTPAC